MPTMNFVDGFIQALDSRNRQKALAQQLQMHQDQLGIEQARLGMEQGNIAYQRSQEAAGQRAMGDQYGQIEQPQYQYSIPDSMGMFGGGNAGPAPVQKQVDPAYAQRQQNFAAAPTHVQQAMMAEAMRRHQADLELQRLQQMHDYQMGMLGVRGTANNIRATQVQNQNDYQQGMLGVRGDANDIRRGQVQNQWDIEAAKLHEQRLAHEEAGRHNLAGEALKAEQIRTGVGGSTTENERDAKHLADTGQYGTLIRWTEGNRQAFDENGNQISVPHPMAIAAMVTLERLSPGIMQDVAEAKAAQAHVGWSDFSGEAKARADAAMAKVKARIDALPKPGGIASHAQPDPTPTQSGAEKHSLVPSPAAAGKVVSGPGGMKAADLVNVGGEDQIRAQVRAMKDRGMTPEQIKAALTAGGSR